VSREETEIHTRLLRCTLAPDECRAYWRAMAEHGALTRSLAFETYAFGQKSEARVEVLLANMRARFDAFDDSLSALQALSLDAADARLVAHWHVMLSDPLYRAFAVFLQARREVGARDVTRDEVSRWVEAQQPGRWSGATRNGWASKLLTTAREAGLVSTRKDPRTLDLPHVSDRALLYLLHLLRGVQIQGSLLDNAYLYSVGLDGGILLDRLRGLRGVTVHKMGELIDLRFDHAGLTTWAEAA